MIVIKKGRKERRELLMAFLKTGEEKKEGRRETLGDIFHPLKGKEKEEEDRLQISSFQHPFITGKKKKHERRRGRMG